MQVTCKSGGRIRVDPVARADTGAGGSHPDSAHCDTARSCDHQGIDRLSGIGHHLRGAAFADNSRIFNDSPGPAGNGCIRVVGIGHRRCRGRQVVTNIVLGQGRADRNPDRPAAACGNRQRCRQNSGLNLALRASLDMHARLRCPRSSGRLVARNAGNCIGVDHVD